MTALHALPERYRLEASIADGAGGEVLRVWDRLLDRAVALKVMHSEHAHSQPARERFLAEAKVTAQLQHPGIVAVHDRGELPDGRLWYAMKEVRGRTLLQVIDAGPPPPTDSVQLRRLVDSFARIAQAVGYAHSRGVVHRDLKPDNLMVGEFGEVLVLDWGVAARVDEPVDAGVVVGTPAYMAPEQARALSVSPQGDVYALGAVLLHLLRGEPPYPGSPQAVFRQLLAGRPPASLRDRGLPDELTELCERALAPEPSDRYEDASRFAADLLVFLDGARRREQALAALHGAEGHRARTAELAREADRLEQRARERLRDVAPSAPLDDKHGGWRLEDEARTRRTEAAVEETRWLQGVHGALSVDPELPEAHGALAAFYRDRVIDAERAGDLAEAARYETLLRGHARGQHDTFLRGEGAVTLHTDPSGAEVLAQRYIETDRRLTLEAPQPLGTTPLNAVALPHGSYLLRIRAPGYHEVRYPVLIERGAHWRGIPPDESEPLPVRLPRIDELGEDDCYVPAGWCWLGGDPLAGDSLRRTRAWVSGFVLRRYPVTNAEFLACLNALVDDGRLDEAERLRPTAFVGLSDAGSPQPLFARCDDGRFRLREEYDGVWRPDWPVVMVTWEAALRYAAWVSERSELPWRLPHELEREKATRGADARVVSWGNHLDPAMTWVSESTTDEAVRHPVTDFRCDESPYGIRGLSGHTRDLCINPWTAEGPGLERGRLIVRATEGAPDFVSVRGGGWASPLAHARAAMRFALRPGQSRPTTGLRLARSFG